MGRGAECQPEECLPGFEICNSGDAQARWGSNRQYGLGAISDRPTQFGTLLYAQTRAPGAYPIYRPRLWKTEHSRELRLARCYRYTHASLVSLFGHGFRESARRM